MTTYAEKISELRELREAKSGQIEMLRTERTEISRQILALEETIRVPKHGTAKAGDIIMQVEPAIMNLKGQSQ